MTLTPLVAWLAGLITKLRGQAADFQAHSAKSTSALSLVFLGRRAIKKELSMNQQEFDIALELLYQSAVQTQKERPHYG